MKVIPAHVQGGQIVPEGVLDLPEGARVAVVADAEVPSVELSADEERRLLEALAEADRGDVITADELLRRLTR